MWSIYELLWISALGFDIKRIFGVGLQILTVQVDGGVVVEMIRCFTSQIGRRTQKLKM